MPILIKEIETKMQNANLVELLTKPAKGKVGIEDYIKIYGFAGYLQNFRHVLSAKELFIENKDAYNSPDDGIHPVPSIFGLKNNIATIELNISY